MLDYKALKQDFPLLSSLDIVYLDNAATTHKPRRVIDAVKRFYEEINANIARGLYELSVKATKLYEEAHELVATLIGARSWTEVVFTRSSTDSANIVAWTMVVNGIVRENDNIVVSIGEHHSNMLPWKMVSELTGAELRFVPVDERGFVDMNRLEELVDDRTKVVAVNIVSNVTGRVNDVRRIARLAHRYGAYVVVDGAQAVPHMKVDVGSLEVDFLFFSGHKMMGPTGTGVLWMREDLARELAPPIRGGGAIRSVRVEGSSLKVDYADPPWKWEPGTPHIAGAVGLSEAVRYLLEIGLDRIAKHEEELTRYLLSRLQELGEVVEGVVGGWDTERRLGIVAFTVKGMAPHAVALALGLRNIAVRAGFHCAEPLHRFLGFNEGSVRASFYLYNGLEDVDSLIEALSGLVKRRGES